jgi:uncharacterized protein YndB with AHSA1/START domain
MAPIMVDTDVTTATIVSVGTFDAAPALVWRALAERELIEQWYGPSDAPASFETHELTPGARSVYSLCTADDEVQPGFLQIMRVEPERRLEFIDGHRGPSGIGPEFLHAVVELEDSGGGSRMFVTQHFADRNDMEQLMLGQLEAVVSTLS